MARARLLLGWLEPLLDALAPRRCPLCQGLAADGVACRAHRLRATGPRPPRCGHCLLALPPALPDGAPCAQCRRDPPALEGGCVLMAWGPLAAPWLLALKHGGRRDLAVPLGRALGALLREELEGRGGGDVCLVPVPLHPIRRWERGYNQAELLAAEAARVADVPVVAALRRRRHGAPQGSALARPRARQVRGSFALAGAGPLEWALASWARLLLARPLGLGPLARAAAMGAGRLGRARSVRGREVWLVDDVSTSGATAREAASLLSKAGARSVRLLLVARAGGFRGAD